MFIDTNILVYAYVTQSPFHQEALDVIQQCYNSGADLTISRQIIREFVATVTRPQSFANPLPGVLTAQHARYLQSRFNVVEDNAQVLANLLNLVEQISMGGKQIHDANIVATMQTYGIPELITHNVANFSRFSHLITITPLIASS